MIHQENFFLRESAKEHFSRKPSSDNPTLDILNGAAEERRGAFAFAGTKVAGFQLGERGKFMERELERPRERERPDKRISPMTFHFDSCQFFS